MKKLYYLIVLTVILGLVLTGCLLSNVGQVPTTEQSGIAYLTRATEDDPDEITLFAGQIIPVGTVEVWDDTVELTVKYNVPDPWCITETHLHVSNDKVDIPVNKKGNPIPGHFEENDEHDCVHEVTYIYNLDDKGWGLCEDLYIAAHAVVVKQLTDGGCAASVSDYSQGTEKDGSPVRSERSEPIYALGGIDNDFFSLGFVDETSGGYIVLEFADYVGTSLTVVEQSPGTNWKSSNFPLGYPLEQAKVYVSTESDNPTDWTYLGMANNQIAIADATGQSHENVFDLEECIKFVKIVDQTDPELHSGSADAFDLDAVCGGPCYQYETAWGDGERFVEKGNWATYFTYKTNTLICPGITNYSTDNIQVLNETEIPGDVRVGQFESNVYVRVWKEFEGPLPANLQYDLADGDIAINGVPSGHPYSIDTGTDVCIFYVHFDSVGELGKEQTGYLTFGADILGVILSGGNLGDFAGKNLMFAADQQVEHDSTTYPTMSGNDYLRGYDVNAPGNSDNVWFSGKRVDFITWVKQAHDSFRVIVPMVPAPCE